MRESAPYKCDYCGTRKGDANHWWLRTIRGNFFVLGQWDDEAAEELDEKHEHVFEHICSESCASKALSKHMARLSQQQKPATPEEVVESAIAVRDAGAVNLE